MSSNELSIIHVKNEINKQLGDKETFNALLTTTFKGLQPTVVKRAVLEGVLRGFTFKDFLEKNVYAIPFKDGYALVTSIDRARKIGQKSGIVGKSAPTFEMDKKVIISCTVTVKKKIDNYVGDFTATVYFQEYYKPGTGGRSSLWDTKPRTMIAKVAEMHALRMACPEELSQSYTEEELEKENQEPEFDTSDIPDDAKVISTGDDTQGIDTPSPEEVAEIEKKTNEGN